MAYVDPQPDSLRGRIEMRVPRLPGIFGVGQTLVQMARLAHRDSRHPAVLALAGELFAGTQNLSAGERAVQVRNRLGSRFAFVTDGRSATLAGIQNPNPRQVELLQTPARLAHTLGAGGVVTGDCDCASTLLASIGLIGHYPVRFIATATGQHGTNYDHVLAEWFADGAWVNMDIVSPTAPRLKSWVWRI